jgi:hypothetical protein
MSKGSAPRPFSVTQEEYNSRWDAIFGRDLDDKPDKKELPRGSESPRNDVGGNEMHSDRT